VVESNVSVLQVAVAARIEHKRVEGEILHDVVVVDHVLHRRED
jgi:hypothetical protein